MSLKSTNPFTCKIIEEFEELSDSSIQRILSCSASAFETWKKSDFNSREALLRRTANLLHENVKELSLVITNEMGKPVTESAAEIEKCTWVCKYYAENGESFLSDEPVETDAYKSYVRYEPLGTILGIMPWNFPFWQVFRFAVPALMAGNAVLLKHASNVQRCAREIERIFSNSGFPPDVFRNLSIGSGKVGRIIESDVVKGVSLTGSEMAGQKVAEIAGRNLKKTLLELGGSNAFIVLEDADIEKAAEIGVRARMMNAGQSCIAAKRFIVQRNISDKFLERFKYYLDKLKQGDPADYETNIGPLASVQQAMAVEDQVNRSVKLGARIFTGGRRTEAFYSPSILLDVHPGMPVFDEEVFGPVAPVSIARDISEALALARTTKFGLGVSLFTDDLEKAGKIAADFKDGAVFINDLVKSDPRLPFGGTGRSGYGRELSVHGIREFVNVKTVYAKKFK
jgi:succinate-semialdehyde dehydrogenase / glutarate-semialdehyde dehydrogenase